MYFTMFLSSVGEDAIIVVLSTHKHLETDGIARLLKDRRKSKTT